MCVVTAIAVVTLVESGSFELAGDVDLGDLAHACARRRPLSVGFTRARLA